MRAHNGMPNHRRSEFDVCDKINTTDYEQVAAEIDRMYSALYKEQPGTVLQTAFRDAASLYRGDSHGYHACDTEYHDIQHVLDVTLAMARMMDGCKRATNDARLDATMFRLGIIAALYHDAGYIRSVHDTRHKHGADGGSLLRFKPSVKSCRCARPIPSWRALAPHRPVQKCCR